MKITSKGQVTIPQEIRERYGLLPGTEVEFVAEGGAVRVVRAERGAGRGQEVVRHLRGRATSGLTTEEILSLTRGEGECST